jgi:hypothetical protein
MSEKHYLTAQNVGHEKPFGCRRPASSLTWPENEGGQNTDKQQSWQDLEKPQYQKREIAFVLLTRSGAPGGIRTPGLLVRRKAVKNSKCCSW